MVGDVIFDAREQRYLIVVWDAGESFEPLRGCSTPFDRRIVTRFDMRRADNARRDPYVMLLNERRPLGARGYRW